MTLAAEVFACLVFLMPERAADFTGMAVMRIGYDAGRLGRYRVVAVATLTGLLRRGIRAFFLTLGGVTVNPKFEALNAQGDVIGNLYVTVQDIGGLYGSSYDLKAEGLASSFALTPGRLAAENAIKDIKACR